MTQTNQKIMHQLIDEVINNRRLDVIDDIVHVDYVYRSPGEELHGREALKAMLKTYQDAMPDLNIVINESLYFDTKTVLIFTLTGTHENEFMGVEASGRRVNISGMIWSRFEDEKIIEEWELLDQLTLYQQLGLVAI